MVQISKERFALGSYQYLRYPFEYFLDTAVLLGMQNVELWAAGPSFCLDTMDEAQLKEKVAQIRSRELSVCCITPEQCQYPVNLAAEDEKIREYSIRNFERAFYAAEILNCPKVLVSAGCGYFNKPVEDAWKRSEESLHRLSEKAQKMGILLVLETLTPLSSNVLNTPEQQKEMISLMPSGSMKPMLDIGQMVYMDQKIELGFLTAAMALSDRSVSIADPALSQEEKLAIILGTEGDRLAASTIAACDYTVKIPMSHGVDSLNVAAASAVAFWQLGMGNRK